MSLCFGGSKYSKSVLKMLGTQKTWQNHYLSEEGGASGNSQWNGLVLNSTSGHGAKIKEAVPLNLLRAPGNTDFPLAGDDCDAYVPRAIKLISRKRIPANPTVTKG